MRKRTSRTPRFHIQSEIQCNSELTLDKQVSHHLVTVLRARKDDSLLLFNGDGHDYQATVLETGQRSAGKKARLQIQGRQQLRNESPLKLSLIQCISRPDRMDISLRQAVELGVSHIQPVYSHHTAKPPEAQRVAKRHSHWHSIVLSACEQSGRATVPSLAQARQLGDWYSELQTDPNMSCAAQSNRRCRSFVLNPGAENSLKSAIESPDSSVGRHDAVNLLVGPESGLDPSEIESAVNAGMLEAHLGPRILRTETAGAIAITLMQSMLGDLQEP